VIASVLDINPDKKVVAVCNGAAALHALAAALELREGRRLRFATQSYTFPSAAQGPLRDAAIVDVASDDLGPELEVVPGDCDVLVVTNVLGHGSDVRRYERWCTAAAPPARRYLLFDNAATAMTEHDGRNLLNYGDGSIVSFHHTKPLGFGEGGAVVVPNELEPYVRRAINFGYDVPRADVLWQGAGSNYKMSDVAAAYIIQHLERFAQKTREHHRRLHARFLHLLETLSPTVTTLRDYSDRGTAVVSCLPVLFDREVSVGEFEHDGIVVRKYYKPLVQTGRAWDLYRRIICFPCHIDMREEDVCRIVRIIRRVAACTSEPSSPVSTNL
ncbi:DegT/DnrJ/EryC1/StrS family aminotransferase, partial [uncultured virus]